MSNECPQCGAVTESRFCPSCDCDMDWIPTEQKINAKDSMDATLLGIPIETENNFKKASDIFKSS